MQVNANKPFPLEVYHLNSPVRQLLIDHQSEQLLIDHQLEKRLANDSTAKFTSVVSFTNDEIRYITCGRVFDIISNDLINKMLLFDKQFNAPGIFPSDFNHLIRYAIDISNTALLDWIFSKSPNAFQYIYDLLDYASENITMLKWFYNHKIYYHTSNIFDHLFITDNVESFEFIHTYFSICFRMFELSSALAHNAIQIVYSIVSKHELTDEMIQLIADHDKPAILKYIHLNIKFITPDLITGLSKYQIVVLKWLYKQTDHKLQFISYLDDGFINKMILNNKLDVIKWICNICKANNQIKQFRVNAFYKSFKTNNLKLIKFIYKNIASDYQIRNDTNDLLSYPLYSSCTNIAIFKWLLEMNIPCKKSHLKIAITYCNLSIIKLIYQIVNAIDDLTDLTELMYTSIKYQSLDTIQWIKQFNIDINYKMVSLAIKHQPLEVIQMLCNTQLCNEDLSNAIIRCDLSIIKYVYSHQSDIDQPLEFNSKIFYYSMTIEILQWLHDNIPNFTCSSDILDICIMYHRLDIIIWLYENYPMIIDLVDISEGALYEEQFQILKWVYKINPESVLAAFTDQFLTDWLTNNIFIKLEIDNLNWIKKIRKIDNLQIKIGYIYEDVEVLQWLHDNTNLSFTEDAIDHCDKLNYNAIQWLTSNGY